MREKEQCILIESNIKTKLNDCRQLGVEFTVAFVCARHNNHSHAFCKRITFTSILSAKRPGVYKSSGGGGGGSSRRWLLLTGGAFTGCTSV